MSYNHLYAGALLAVIFFLIRPIVQALVSPLRSVPGPFLARFTRLWELHVVRKHDFATYNVALHKKYGPVVRLAPNRYSINDAEATRVLLGYHNALNKSNYYIAFSDPSLTNTFTELDIQTHAKMRRPSAHLYANTHILSYEPFIDTCNSILLKRLREYSWTGKRLDVRELMQYYAFDVIGEITMGSRFGMMEEDGDSTGVISSLDETLLHGSRIGLIPELHYAFLSVTKIFKLKNPLANVFNFITTSIQDRASGRTKSPDDREDFLDKLLPLEASGKCTRYDTILACGANIVAGSDTTAISLTAAIAYLAMTPNALAKLREELDSADALDPISFKDAQKLPYLRAVIYETLRMHPAVGAPLTRVIGPGGAQLAGYFFPPGTEVGVNAWVVHRDTSIFGADADKFNPDRWLIDDSEKRTNMERNWLSFGAGPRVCLGKNISLLEMYKVIPQIVNEFDIDILDEGGKGGYSWKTQWFTKQNLSCVVKERTNA